MTTQLTECNDVSGMSELILDIKDVKYKVGIKGGKRGTSG
jgi:hypothetical protein